jgi:DNA-binding NtrC family response regulator
MKFLGSQVRPQATLSEEGVPIGGAPAVGEDMDAPRGVFEVVADVPYKQQKANVIADFEERYVRQLMRRHAGNVSAAAREAGIDRMSLHKILARYDLDAKELARG